MINETGSLEYLGALLSADGRADSEISRKIGTAFADFRQLQKLWNHARVSLRDKLHFFDALIASRLSYGLATIWSHHVTDLSFNSFGQDATRCDWHL